MARRDRLAERPGGEPLSGRHQRGVRWPDSDRVQRMARVLAPHVARVIPGPPHRSMEEERAWYRIHAQEHTGCWIAVLGDQLPAADPSCRRVHAILSAIPGSDDAVLFFRRARV